MVKLYKTIIVEDYNPNWHKEFEKLKQLYIDTIGDYIIDVVHVGSTSVPGLAAKPIIDMVIIIDLDNFEKVKKGLESLNYHHNGDQGITGREAFHLPPELREKKQRHHLYVCDKNATELKRFLAFKNYLLKYDDIRDEYGEIKKEGARICNHDIEVYMDHKGEFVTTHLVNAMYEANVVPSPNTRLCPNCSSTNIEYNFNIRYEGDGYKSEYFEFMCLECRNQFTEELEEG